MYTLNNLIASYLENCKIQKQLDTKTLKAYRIDLHQFSNSCTVDYPDVLTPNYLEQYIGTLHQSYKPRTVKRKIASLKAFCHYLEFRDIIKINPFHKLQIRFREPLILPKTIPLHTIEIFISTLYNEQNHATTLYQKKSISRDIAIIEILFATGMRISEVCHLHLSDINFHDKNIRIWGKGSKERIIQIGNDEVMHAIEYYFLLFKESIEKSGYFFINRCGNRLSEQSVRDMINKYCVTANISQHITPHMFRHSFATLLLEEDVDIRYIQEMLGHSSINVTQIYTHVSMAKQKDILTSKHPRKDLHFSNK